MLGRKLSVIKTSKKEAIWVKGEVKDFDEPAVRHKVGSRLQINWMEDSIPELAILAA